jgi:hypothetical protein
MNTVAQQETRIIESWVNQYDLIVNLLDDEGLSPWSKTINFMDKILEGMEKEVMN